MIPALSHIVRRMPDTLLHSELIPRVNEACGLTVFDTPNPGTSYSWTEILAAIESAGFRPVWIGKLQNGTKLPGWSRGTEHPTRKERPYWERVTP